MWFPKEWHPVAATNLTEEKKSTATFLSLWEEAKATGLRAIERLKKEKP